MVSWWLKVCEVFFKISKQHYELIYVYEIFHAIFNFYASYWVEILNKLKLINKNKKQDYGLVH